MSILNPLYLIVNFSGKSLKNSKSEHAETEKIVGEIFTIKRQNPQANTEKLEGEIDRLVYQLHRLTADEIAIVEGAGKSV